MGAPKKVLRGKAAQKLHEEVAKEFFRKIQKLLEEGKLGKETKPVTDYLSNITRMKLSELAKQKQEEFNLGEKETLAALSQIAKELESGPQSELKLEVAKVRAKLEEKVRGL